MLILVFDTETANQASNYKLKAHEDLNNYPFIMQLGAKLIKVDTDMDLYLNPATNHKSVTYETVMEYNNLVYPTRKGEPIELSNAAFEVHGISLGQCELDGLMIEEVILMLQGMITMADVIICHNVNFDKNVVQSEALRLGLEIKVAKRSIVWCSMLNTVETCKIPSQGKAIHYSKYKWPTLAELFKFCTHENIEDVHTAHDAMGDVNATIDCVIALLKKDINLFDKNVT